MIPSGNPHWTQRQGGDQVRVCGSLGGGLILSEDRDSYGFSDLDVMK